jgi:hypothetical protein
MGQTDKYEASLTQWGRFALVGECKDADLTFVVKADTLDELGIGPRRSSKELISLSALDRRDQSLLKILIANPTCTSFSRPEQEEKQGWQEQALRWLGRKTWSLKFQLQGRRCRARLGGKDEAKEAYHQPKVFRFAGCLAAVPNRERRALAALSGHQSQRQRIGFVM